MTRENPCYSYTEHEVKDEMRYYIYVSTTKYVPIYEIAQLRSHNTSDTTTAHFLKTKLFHFTWAHHKHRQKRRRG